MQISHLSTGAAALAVDEPVAGTRDVADAADPTLRSGPRR